MKKLLIVLGVVTAFLTSTAFVTTEKANTLLGSGDGITSCPVHNTYGYTVAVVETKIVSPDENTNLGVHVKLNKENKPNQVIKVVVQLRNSDYVSIEHKTIEITGSNDSGYGRFIHRAPEGEVFYVTIESAYCYYR